MLPSISLIFDFQIFDKYVSSHSGVRIFERLLPFRKLPSIVSCSASSLSWSSSATLHGSIWKLLKIKREADAIDDAEMRVWSGRLRI